jgi:hypothetical protein
MIQPRSAHEAIELFLSGTARDVIGCENLTLAEYGDYYTQTVTIAELDAADPPPHPSWFTWVAERDR